MKRSTLKKSCLILLLLTLPAAGTTPLESMTQTGMNIESGENANKADVELNKVYKKLMVSLEDEQAREKLKTAQRLWVKFRDAECESERDDARGGSIAPMVCNECFERLTQERTSQLQDRFQP